MNYRSSIEGQAAAIITHIQDPTRQQVHTHTYTTTTTTKYSMRQLLLMQMLRFASSWFGHLLNEYCNRKGACTLAETVLGTSCNGLQIAAATSSGCLPADCFCSPVNCINQIFRILVTTYTCGFSEMGSHKTHSGPSGCGMHGGCSVGTKCATCLRAYQSWKYLLSKDKISDDLCPNKLNIS